MSKVSISLFIVVALLISACNVGTNAGSDSEVLNGQVRDIEVIATQPTFSGQMVTDTRVGFTFNYPDDWTLITPQDLTNAVAYSYTVQSFEPSVEGGGGVVPDETKIDIFVNASETIASLDSIRERLRGDESNGNLTVAQEERLTINSGVEALVIHGTGFQGGDFVGIYTIINGHEVSLIGIGDEQAIMQVAHSLRPVSQ